MYENALREEGIDGDVPMDLSAAALKEVGVEPR